jgi:signal transduction histidine kinase
VRNLSLRARLLAAFAYTLLVVIVALEVPLASNVGDRVDTEIEGDSASQAQIIAASASGQLGQHDELVDIAARAGEQFSGDVAIVDGQGSLLVDSGPLGSKAATFEPGSEVPEALGGSVAQRRRSVEGGKHQLVVTGAPVVLAGQTRGAVILTQDVDSAEDSVRSDVLALVGVGALALALGLGVAWILAGSIARPLRSLAAVARRMATGDLDARATERGSSEQVDVARSFNEMADRVQALLESQRAFVADASHQLRTPLTGLRLRLEAAGVKSRDPEVARELEAAERETERLDLLVADLLELASSEEPGEDAEAELSEAARAAAERWRDPAAETSHRIEVTGEGDAAVRAAPRDLAIILDNLLENAIKYSPRGSEVEVSWAMNSAEATLRVDSAGGPLEDEEADRAFERFYRGAAGGRRPGTGLGLAIVAALARRSGGSARLTNIERGVRAEVTLRRRNPAGLPSTP